MQRPPALDTLQAVRDITKTGMTEDTAEAIVTIINRAVADTAASHFDLREVKTQLEKERDVQNANLRGYIQKGIGAVRTEIETVRTDVANHDSRVVKLFGAVILVLGTFGTVIYNSEIIADIFNKMGLMP